MLRIPILTYHALHAPGTSYTSNDHVALEDDLALIRTKGFEIVPLMTVVKYLTEGTNQWLNQGRFIALSFDDGTDHDYIDFVYPEIPTLKSFYTLLLEHKAKIQPQYRKNVNGTSFVIASPDARAVLDQTCIANRNQWRDSWWNDANKSGTLSIANHSWDHCHPSLEKIAQRDQLKGTFSGVDNYADADRQILNAEIFINEKLSASTGGLFAYPFGECNDFLVDEYFPKNAATFSAAFTTAGDYLTNQSNRWRIPRFVCGEHWRSTGELNNILSGAVSS